jgi:hypothetical protein
MMRGQQSLVIRRACTIYRSCWRVTCHKPLCLLTRLQKFCAA